MICARILPYLAAAGLAALAVWRVYAWGYDTADTEWSARHTAAQLRAERAAVAQLNEREKRRAALARALGKANEEQRDMAVRLAAGTGRVYVRAACPNVPTPAPDAGGAGGGTAELDPAARQDYLVLRQALKAQHELLLFCRAELRARSR